MRHVALALSLLFATSTAVQSQGAASFQGGRQLVLTVTDGAHEAWIRVTRSCPSANCDNGRGGFTSTLERSPGFEKLGSASSTFYVPHSATVKATASIVDGTVPAGHALKIYWQGWPKDEDPACRTTSGSTCTSSRQVAPTGTPYAPIVCATLVYEGGGTNLADGYQAICANIAYGAGTTVASFKGGRAITLTVNDGAHESWIRVTRACPRGNCDDGRGGFTTQVERSPGFEPLGSSSATFYVAHSSNVRAIATIMDGAVPAGHALKLYWQGWPKDEDPACRASSGSECTSSRQVAPAGTPYAPIVCATLGYEGGGTNLAGGYQAICVNIAYRK